MAEVPANPNLIDEKDIPESWVPAENSVSSAGAAPSVPNEMPTFFSGSLAPQLQHDGSFVGTEVASPRVPKFALMPFGSQSSGFTNAAAQSTATKVVETVPQINLIAGTGITITKSGNNETISATATGDGLVHGTTPWEIDPSAVIWNEEFITTRVAQGTNSDTSPFIGSSTSWLTLGSGVSGNASFNLLPSHIGVQQFYNATTTANTNTIFTPTDNGVNVFGAGADMHLLPLLDNPGWKATWVFMFSKAWANGQSPIANVFSVAKTSTYIGFASAIGPAAGTTGIQSFNGFRPNIFLGLRYDTDPGQSGLSVTAVSAPVSGVATYTGTFPLGGSNYYIGNNITITGCAAANNNGTFICTGSTTTTLLLRNAAATLASGQTASAACPGLNDTTMKFEWVANPFNSNSPANICRNNTQGTVVDTGITPTENVWYRLDFVCTAIGVVQLTLSGGGSQSTTSMTCTTVTLGDTSLSGSFQFFQTDGWVEAQAGTGSYVYNGTNCLGIAFGMGSILTITNPPTGLTSPITLVGTTGAVNNLFFDFPSAITTGTKNTTFTGYPALWPIFMFGNDSTGSAPTGGRAWNLDFFGLAYNPGLAGAAVNAKQSRYFSGT